MADEITKALKPFGLVVEKAELRTVLERVADLMESIYEHNADGSRYEDGDSPMSGSDVIDALGGLEDDVFRALDRKPGWERNT